MNKNINLIFRVSKYILAVTIFFGILTLVLYLPSRRQTIANTSSQALKLNTRMSQIDDVWYNNYNKFTNYIFNSLGNKKIDDEQVKMQLTILENQYRDFYYLNKAIIGGVGNQLPSAKPVLQDYQTNLENYNNIITSSAKNHYCLAQKIIATNSQFFDYNQAQNELVIDSKDKTNFDISTDINNIIKGLEKIRTSASSMSNCKVQDNYIDLSFIDDSIKKNTDKFNQLIDYYKNLQKAFVSGENNQITLALEPIIKLDQGLESNWYADIFTDLSNKTDNNLDNIRIKISYNNAQLNDKILEQKNKFWLK